MKKMPVHRRDAEGAESIIYIFLLRWRKYMNCHGELFFSGLSPENKINRIFANSVSLG